MLRRLLMPGIGHKRWAIAEGYIPSGSVSQEPTLVSHETICLLNAGDKDAKIEITLYFEDHGPVGPYRVDLGAQRTLHLRFNDLKDPCPGPTRRRLRLGDRSRCANRCATHAARFAPSQYRAAVDYRVPRRLAGSPAAIAKIGGRKMVRQDRTAVCHRPDRREGARCRMPASSRACPAPYSGPIHQAATDR